MEVLGLASCDTCRKARRALAAAGHRLTYRDLRQDPLPPEEIAALIATHGAALVNRRSTTWRGLSDAERAGDPLALLMRHPALMKRPVIRTGTESRIGWGPDVRAAFGTD